MLKGHASLIVTPHMKARTIKAIRDDPNNVFISFSDGSTYRFHHWAYKESYELVYYSTSGKDVIYSEGHYFSLYKGQVETWQSKSLWRNEQYCGYVYTKSRKILSHVSQIVTGIGRTYFLMLDGTVKTCGRTDDPKGVLGLGELSNSEKPVTIPGLAKVKKYLPLICIMVKCYFCTMMAQ